MKIFGSVILYSIAFIVVVFAVITLINDISNITAWFSFLFAALLVLIGIVVARKGIRGAAGAVYDGSPDIDKLK